MIVRCVQDPTEKAQSLLTSMKKPTEKQALALSKLFPASKKFNPHAECVAKAAHAKKKKFSAAPKHTSVTVVLLKELPDTHTTWRIQARAG